MNDFELERQQRIETNRKRMLEMGIQAMASKIQAPAPVPAPPVRARPFQTHQSNPFLFPARLHPERRAASLDDDTRGVARPDSIRITSRDIAHHRSIRFFVLYPHRPRAHYADDCRRAPPTFSRAPRIGPVATSPASPSPRLTPPPPTAQAMRQGVRPGRSPPPEHPRARRGQLRRALRPRTRRRRRPERRPRSQPSHQQVEAQGAARVHVRRRSRARPVQRRPQGVRLRAGHHVPLVPPEDRRDPRHGTPPHPRTHPSHLITANIHHRRLNLSVKTRPSLMTDTSTPRSLLSPAVHRGRLRPWTDAGLLLRHVPPQPPRRGHRRRRRVQRVDLPQMPRVLRRR